MEKYYLINISWQEANTKYELKSILSCKDDICKGVGHTKIDNGLDCWTTESYIIGTCFGKNGFKLCNLDFTNTLGYKVFSKHENKIDCFEQYLYTNLPTKNKSECVSAIREVKLDFGEKYSFDNSLKDYDLRAKIEFKWQDIELLMKKVLSKAFVEQAKNELAIDTTTTI